MMLGGASSFAPDSSPNKPCTAESIVSASCVVDISSTFHVFVFEICRRTDAFERVKANIGSNNQINVYPSKICGKL